MADIGSWHGQYLSNIDGSDGLFHTMPADLSSSGTAQEVKTGECVAPWVFDSVGPQILCSGQNSHAS